MLTAVSTSLRAWLSKSLNRDARYMSMKRVYDPTYSRRAINEVSEARPMLQTSTIKRILFPNPNPLAETAISSSLCSRFEIVRSATHRPP